MIQYSKQPSTLKPDGVDSYIRLQVSQRQQLQTIVLPVGADSDLVSAMQEGRLIGLTSSTGAPLGQFQVTLVGGYLPSEFISPTASVVNIGFKPSPALLASVRDGASFEQVPTAVVVPVINTFSYLANSGNSYQDTIPVQDYGTLRIRGNNFPSDARVTFSFWDGVDPLTQYSVTLSEARAISVKGRNIEWLVANNEIDKVSVTPTGPLTPPAYARLTVYSASKPSVSGTFDFTSNGYQPEV